MGTYIINDPVHGPMGFTEEEHSWIKPIIDHELFQRLRDIKQNGLAHLVFPGAVHTRFNHCIGACWVAKRMMDSLEQNLRGYLQDERKDKHSEIINDLFKGSPNKLTRYKRLVMQAALLHDVTHGPMSHAFDKLFEDSDIEIVHEDWTESFVEKILGAGGSKDKHDNDVMNITNLITGNREQNNLKEKATEKKLPLFLFDIISSQLDADRLDYLLRDSHFCGVAYGKYRIDWIIQCLTLSCKDEDLNKWRLGILSKAIGDVEHYLMARRLMTLHVCSHKKVCAAQHLFGTFLKLLLGEHVQENNTLKRVWKDPKVKYNNPKLEKFIDLTRKRLNETNCSRESLDKIKDWYNRGDKKANLLQVIKSLFCKNPSSAYECYKKLKDCTLWDEINFQADKDKKDEINIVAGELKNRELPFVLTIDEQSYYSLKKNVEGFINDKNIKNWELKCERPISDFYTYKNEKEIFVVDCYKNTQDEKDKNQEDVFTSTNIKHLSRIAKEFLERPDKPSYLYIDRNSVSPKSPNGNGNEIIKFIFEQMDIGLIPSYNKSVLLKIQKYHNEET